MLVDWKIKIQLAFPSEIRVREHKDAYATFCQSIYKVDSKVTDFSGTWIWVESRQEAEYLNWAETQPNNHGDEDCVLMTNERSHEVSAGL